MIDHYGDSEERELPNPPHWTKVLGVGIVVSALAVGTGELIMWPRSYLVRNTWYHDSIFYQSGSCQACPSNRREFFYFILQAF